MAKFKRDQKTVTLNLRVSPQEWKEWHEAADKSRRTFSQWVRDNCNAAYVEQMK